MHTMKELETIGDEGYKDISQGELDYIYKELEPLDLFNKESKSSQNIITLEMLGGYDIEFYYNDGILQIFSKFTNLKESFTNYENEQLLDALTIPARYNVNVNLLKLDSGHYILTGSTLVNDNNDAIYDIDSLLIKFYQCAVLLNKS